MIKCLLSFVFISLMASPANAVGSWAVYWNIGTVQHSQIFSDRGRCVAKRDQLLRSGATNISNCKFGF